MDLQKENAAKDFLKQQKQKLYLFGVWLPFAVDGLDIWFGISIGGGGVTLKKSVFGVSASLHSDLSFLFFRFLSRARHLSLQVASEAAYLSHHAIIIVIGRDRGGGGTTPLGPFCSIHIPLAWAIAKHGHIQAAQSKEMPI